MTTHSIPVQPALALDEARRAAFEHLAIGVVVGTWPGRIVVDANPAALRMLGYAREELVGQSARGLHVDEAHAAEFGARVARIFAEGAAVDLEWPARRKDGSTFVASFRMNPLRDAAGEVVGVVTTLRDLTEEKRAARALRESEARYRFLAENVSDVTARTGPDGVVRYVSPAVRRVLGYEPEEIVGTVGSALMHPEDLGAVSERKRPESEESWIVTARYRHKDGRWVWIESSNVAVRDAKGEVVEILSTARDVTERQRAVTRLEESNRRFHLIARATNDVVWDWDLVTNRLWWNERFHDQFGYAPEETPPGIDSWTDHIHPEDRERVVRSIHAAIDGGRDDWSDEYRFLRKDGASAYILDRGYVVRDASGRAVRMVGSMLDLTPRRKTEEQLKESLERFELVSTATDEVPWDWDVDSGRIWWSANFARLFGGHEARTYQDWAKRVHPEDRERVVRSLESGLAGSGTIWREEYRLGRHDGTYAIVFDRARILRDDEGRARRLVGSIMDITDRKRAERTLAEQRDRYEALLQAQSDLGDGIVVTRGTVVTWANAAYARLVGHPLEDLTSGSFDARRLVPPEDVEGALGRGRDHDHYEARLLRADGTLVDVEVASKAIGAGPDAPRVAVVRDATARKASEKELEATRKQLAVSEKLTALGSLVSGVAHEVRTPLAYLMNAVSLIRMRLPRALATGDEKLAASVLEQAASAEEAVDRINRLVEDLRKFTRLRVDDATTGDLSRVVREAADLFQATHVGQARVEAELEPTPEVHLDRVRVQQVVLNLLENALDARPPDHALTVRTGATDAGGAFVEVEDRGVGIPPRIRGRLFDPFFTTKADGTGLGLSIVKRIVEEHRAAIEVDSEPGRGTRVRVTFPPPVRE